MNTGVVTIGLVPLTIGSVERFVVAPLLNDLPWLLTGGSVTLTLHPPSGGDIVVSATINGYSASVPWTVIAPAGSWLLAWTITDAIGRKQVSQPLPFSVVYSPA